MEIYAPAALWRRGMAWWIDLLAASIPGCVWIIGVWSDIGGCYRTDSGYQEYLWQDWLPWMWLGVAFLYYFLCEALGGATLGKFLLNLKVVRADGSACGWKESLIRNAVRVFDGIFFWWLGVASIVLSKKRQRLGDRLAGTIVMSRHKA